MAWGGKTFRRRRNIVLLIAAAMIAAVLVNRAQAEPWPPEADCAGDIRLQVRDDIVRVGERVEYAVTGPDGGQFTLTLGVSGLERATPDTTAITDRERRAGDEAAILAENLTVTGCLLTGDAEMTLPFGEYTLRLWDTSGAEPEQIAEVTVDSDG